MDGETQNFENIPGGCLTLAEVSEKVKGNYPLVVKVVSKENEKPSSQELTGDSELLLEKPRWLQFVLIRILDFLDGEKATEEKGTEFIQTRKAYVGKDFLIPVCYPGTFKLVRRQGQHSRYVSIEQIIENLPRFIKLNQEIEYDLPDKPRTIIPAGTKLEVKNVQVSGKDRYIKCKSSKGAYTFREDFPINCTAVDDHEEHTLLNLAGEFVLLPKDVQFESVCAEDVVLKDDDDASTLLTLLGGPVKILKSFIRRNVFIAWMTREGACRNTVAFIPHRIWNNHMVEVKSFQDKEQKQKYIVKRFGDQLDSNFVVNGLYLLKPVETDVIWLTAPTKSKEQKLVDYESVIRSNDKMVIVDAEKYKDEGDEAKDYGNPTFPESLILPNPPVSQVPPKPTVPKVPPRISTRTGATVLLPTAKPNKEDILKIIKYKAKLGFDKVHEQLLRRVRRTKTVTSETESEKKNKQCRRSQSESDKKQISTIKKERKKSKSLSERDSSIDLEKRHSYRLNLTYEQNKRRPLPPTPLQTLSFAESVNATDDDKLVIIHHVVDLETAECTLGVTQDYESNSAQNRSDTILRFPYLYKIGQDQQRKDDFYLYTVKEVVECLKMCNLEKFAVLCSTHKLDGAFFKNFALDQLLSEPFCLSKFELIKVKKVIEDGWRPKTAYDSFEH